MRVLGQSIERTWTAIVLAVVLSLTLSVAQDGERVRARYTKFEYLIPMRDGVHLFTAVYVPKDKSPAYPFLLTRTPYSVSPYGVDNYRSRLGPSPEFEDEGFIFVYQDSRGRYMSEGEFQQVRPHRPQKTSKRDIDESTDTYDTIEWFSKISPVTTAVWGWWGFHNPDSMSRRALSTPIQP